MTQRKKTLATSFATVADDINKNVEEKVNANNNVNIDTDNIVKSMVSEKPQKKNEKKLTGIYFDPDVSVALDRLKASGKMKVSKSVFVNNVVKAALKENGLM
ncbi:hypothetical protein [Sporolactobacillus terrae]|uniref:hypothetical protein n=1 Tax=Sporolactobacillus terrae TaxID=269673 RepID=UPI00111807AD|nr:hypothetical protein [Sporolactobacillus terrae]